MSSRHRQFAPAACHWCTSEVSTNPEPELYLERKLTILRFAHWAAKYGPIFSLKLGSRTAIVLSSPAVVRELIDKQSAIFSDRPRFYIADHHIMHGDHLMFRDADPRWRRGRRLYHGYFNERACEHDHVQLQNAEAVQLLRDLCTHPEDFMRHCRRFSNSAMMCFGGKPPAPRILVLPC